MALRLSEGLGSARHAYLAVAASLCLIYSCDDNREVAFDSWPTGREQNDDRQTPVSEILLILQILVCRYENLESGSFCSSDQFTVLKLRPSLFVRCDDLMIHQRFAQRGRRALIEEHLHSGCFEGTARNMLEYGFRLLRRDAREPLDKLV